METTKLLIILCISLFAPLLVADKDKQEGMISIPVKSNFSTRINNSNTPRLSSAC